MRCGGAASLCLACTPGRMRTIPCAWWSSPGKREIPTPKALACYGVLWQEGTPQGPQRDQMWLRFVTGRPVSAITRGFLDWCCERLAAQGKRNWLLIWDHASWHKSLMVRTWIREHNQQVKQTGKGVRILPFLLPTQSPWLNPIEPKWVHGKKAIVEPKSLLTAQQLAERICSHGWRVPMNLICSLPKRSRDSALGSDITR